VNESGLQSRFEIDSAGTHAYHIGEQSDPRSRALAVSKGIDMEYVRARKISINDYDHFDYILAMDNENLELIEYYAPQDYPAQIMSFLSFANANGDCQESEVPDPYYGGEAGFDHVFRLVGIGCDALIKHVLD
jgi:protein-tyrosine phosphatase